MDRNDKPYIIIKIDPDHLKVLNEELKRLNSMLADPNVPKETRDFVQAQIKEIHTALLPKAQ